MIPYMYHTQSFNRYSYTRNNPLKYIDPSGQSDLLAFSGYSSSFINTNSYSSFGGYNYNSSTYSSFSSPNLLGINKQSATVAYNQTLDLGKNAYTSLSNQVKKNNYKMKSAFSGMSNMSNGLGSSMNTVYNRSDEIANSIFKSSSTLINQGIPDMMLNSPDYVRYMVYFSVSTTVAPFASATYLSAELTMGVGANYVYRNPDLMLKGYSAIKFMDDWKGGNSPSVSLGTAFSIGNRLYDGGETP